MRKTKRISLLLALALLVSCLTPFSALAAENTFSDLNDPDTASNVEVLRMMGVLDGYADGTFRPNATLTRAQFCKMAVLMTKNGADQVGQYKNYTIFPDVKASHWASGYINMAVRGEKATEETAARPGIIAGYPDGTFRPDSIVTYGQAVTILMRLLGYADKDVGAVWPDGYLNAASTIGLTDGLKLTGSASITRGKAAQLFVNLLNTNMKDSTSTYAASIANSLVADTVLLSCSATASDGTSGALQTSDGTYKPARNSGSGLLNGRKGTVLLDASGKALTFVPVKAGSSETFNLSVAKAGYLQDNAGHRYEVTAKTVAYHNGEKTTYGEMYTYLRSGSSVTVYFNAAGTAEYVFSGSESTTDAVVVPAKGSTNGFTSLTGGSTNYKLSKNGLTITSSDLRANDVATYNAATNTIQVCDTRLTGVIENVYPNFEAPTSLTVIGHEFEVLPSAGEMLSGFKVNDSVSLLLTVDNKVAGAVANTAATRSNAIGMVTAASGTSATVQLLSGLELTGNTDTSAEYNSKLQGQLVRVSSSRRGTISLATLSGGSYNTLDMSTRKIGNAELADNVMVYEKAHANAPVQPIVLSQIVQNKINGSNIAFAEYDWAGRVSLLILNNVTGDTFTYGRVRMDEGSLTVSYDNGKSVSATSAYKFADGSFAGVAVNSAGSQVVAVMSLKQLDNVPNNAWKSSEYVTVGGVTYPVSEDVVCYNRTTGKFLTLSAARAFASTATLYYDRTVDEGGKIRVVEVR
ncbi:S-layer homology domain-containing protein [Oscillibacter sp. MSJ-2]|uniref:S-layer homology domain-containing protein n=1 Tax=Dysosmobacter acutus TaxID=2841504 RepID=A0ABS6FCU5_9FIRM|nr:S-layer homology domain-containing protein [Dysosmobacter acutus]MBU5628086.1 S-layer homology domain-containing protein [Dysosmobacter acutus]